MASETHTDFHTNPSNPFFLHSNENLALALVSPMLDGKNYHAWAQAMKLALKSKNKLRFNDDTLP